MFMDAARAAGSLAVKVSWRPGVSANGNASLARTPSVRWVRRTVSSPASTAVTVKSTS